jgi:hypothetical protein
MEILLTAMGHDSASKTVVEEAVACYGNAAKRRKRGSVLVELFQGRHRNPLRGDESEPI